MDNMNPAPAAGKVIRAPSLKRGKNDDVRISDRVKLERVLGLTVSSNAALDCDPETEVVAYPAGCTVVLFNPRKNKQTHLLNTSRKTITCLAFSADGRYLVTGECGHLPSVRVWDLQEGGGTQIAEFPGHKYGINCVAFSPSHKYVVSVGSQHDMIVNVWDWRANVKVASNKVSAKVKAVSFAENGNYFVTVGNRHVKFWYLEYSRSAKYKEPVPLMGRSAILGEQRNNYFCDVACGRGEMGDSTYAITKAGLLCEFNNRRLLDKWVELRTTSANCMTVGENLIFIGCAEGIVRCFSPSTLQFVTTLPRTHYLGVDVAQGLSISHMATHPNNAKYPDAVALAFDHRNLKLTCVYNDHSLYVWDVRDIKRVGKSHSFLFHSACIWGVEMFPTVEQVRGSSVAPAMPAGSFVTCSSDDTIRVWNLDSNLPPDNDTMYKRNIYSNELLKVLYVDPEMTYLKDLDLSGAAAAEKTDSSYDGRNGVRSIRISPDGKHLASGDRAGNIRIHELHNLQELCRIEAHDAEVLCLEYSRQDSGHRLLASASRDRLIHVFSVDEEYNFLQTLDDHSSSITAVRFLNTHDQLQMVSCGADKSIIFRQLTGTPGGTQCQFSRGHNIAGKTTLYDMEVDSGQKHILTACQDRNIRVYNVNNGKHSKTYKGSVSEDGSLIKVVLDSSGIYSATSCTDKTLCVYDYYSGECMATMFGHSELVTGLRFTNDCRRLISASGDGCIFVWKVPHDMVVTMHARLAQQAARAGKRLPAQIPNGLHLDNENFGPPPPEFFDPNANVDQSDYRFSVGQLPLWAKKQITDNSSPPPSMANRQMDLPKGRWAQRLDAGGITVKSVYDSDSIIQIPLGQEKRLDSDGSKDSSIDSGTEVRQYADFRRETMIITKQGGRESTDFVPCPESYQELTNGQSSKQVSSSKVTVTRGSDMTDISRNRHLTDDSSIGSYKYEDMESTEHDGDVEDYSEGEGESTEPEHPERVMYYPPAEETGSDYTVNAMDVEELRRSQRRMKKSQRPERLSDLPLISVSASVSGSQESDEDDDEVSTPSAETAERNLLSMLSVSSTESLDRVGQREKYLKNTFESLSGAEQEAIKDAAGTSISSQFLVRANQGLSAPTLRNVAVINAAKQTRVDSETSRKREELHRRIEETRRKLQSVGYRSNLKSSQSITDLSHIPEKEARILHGANHLHRYTPAGGKQYAASLMHHHLQPSDVIQPSANPIIIHRRNLINPVQAMVAPLSPAKYIAHISKLTLENAISKTPAATFYNTLPTTKTPKNITTPPVKTELTRLRSLPLPNTMSLLSETDPKLTAPSYPSLQYSEIPKECTASLTTKTVMYSTYHTLPSTKKTGTILKGESSSNSAAVVMEITGNICSSVVSNSNSIAINPQAGASVCVGLKPGDKLDSCAPKENVAWVQAPNSSMFSPATSTTKALTAVKTNISNNRQVELSPSKRPVFLNLRSGVSGSGGGSKYNKSRSKPPLTHQSLPESPVCEDMNSPTGLFQNLTDTESNVKPSRIVQQRRSCSYFIDLNTLTDSEQEFQNKNSKNVAKSSESLPATIGRTNLASSEENLLDSCEEEDNNGDFSSDSLEEPSEFSSRTPRRCISDYQIFTRPPELVGYEFERRSASAAGRQSKRTREAFHSQESILSNTSGQLSSCNNSGDILEMCANYEQDRHSSASFFLSLRRRNTNACRSQESILTDESEYQMFSQHDAPKYDRDRHRDSCRSTESILESDYHFTSTQQGNLTDYEQTRHRDSYQSTESILTDDSDCQMFMSSRDIELKNKLFSVGPPKSKVDKSNDKTLEDRIVSEDKQNETTEDSKAGNGGHRPIFRTRSLQDTRTSLSMSEPPPNAASSRPQTPSKCHAEGDNPLLQQGNERPTVASLVRKNSYPRSRPQTPTSLQMQSQFSMLSKSYTTSFEGTMQPNSLDNDQSRKSSGENEQKSSHSSQNVVEKASIHRHRPPTAPKPNTKIMHKPPLKPRQKLSQLQAKQRTVWNNQPEGTPPYSQKPLKANHSIGLGASAANDPNSSSEQSKKSVAADDKDRTVNTPQGEKPSARLNYPRSSFSEENSRAAVARRMGGVKLLCRSFENAVEDYDISDDCAEEDSFPVLGGSGSSTPATSSSAANSPKRLWPPASRAPNQRQLGKRLSTRHQILPSKCSGPDSDDGNQASDSSGLRRACSLSDLTSTSPRKLLHAVPVQVSGKVTSKSGTAGSRTLPRHGLKAGGSNFNSNSNMARSTSMGMLNQSDSESDLSLAQRSNASAMSRVNGLMRPTISSQNKVTNLGSKNTANSQNSRRRGLSSSYSSVNLSQVGNNNNNEDSSSEETSPVGGKPGVRPRSTSIDRSHPGGPANGMQPQPQPRRPGSSLHGRYGSERDLSRPGPHRQGGSKPVPASRQSQLEPSPQELPVKDTDLPSPLLDVASAPLSQQLCSSIADQLTKTADSVVQLYKRLALEGDQTDHRDMLRGLEEAANEAQRTLKHVLASGGTGAMSAESLSAASKLQDIVANSGQGSGGADQANVVAMMQQYSDMLLTMVQQRMGNTTATPGQQKPS